MNYQKLILVGNATNDAERKTSKNNLSYTTFGVGVSDAKNNATFFKIAVFGKLGEAVTAYVKKGREVLVEGRIQVGENGRFNVIADQVKFGPSPAEK